MALNEIDIEQDARATRAHLERKGHSYYLWFFGPPGWIRVPQHISRRDIGDNVKDKQAVTYIEQRMVSAGYRVERLPTNGSVLAAWRITLDM